MAANDVREQRSEAHTGAVLVEWNKDRLELDLASDLVRTIVSHRESRFHPANGCEILTSGTRQEQRAVFFSRTMLLPYLSER